MTLQQTVEDILGRPVTLEEAKDFANDNFGLLSLYLRTKWRLKEMPIDLEEYLEIHYDIVQEITIAESGSDNLVIQTAEEKGQGGLYELAKELTDKFVGQYKDVVWGEEIEYQDTMEEFIKKELFNENTSN